MADDLTTAYKAKYGVDWYECLSDAGTVRGLPARVVLALIIGRMVKLAGSDASAPPLPPEIPAHPYTIGRDNAKIVGWKAFFAGKPREHSPFPSDRRDLHRDYCEGWDAAQERQNKESA